jgi:competence protein ComEA
MPEPTTPTVPRPEFDEHRFDAFTDRLGPLRRDPRVAVALLIVGALAAGAIWYQIGSRSGAAVSVGRAPSTAAATGAASSPTGTSPTSSGAGGDRGALTTTSTGGAGEVVVDVAGDVVRPGVVHLPAGARVTDAVTAAGGARPDADLGRLNLAAKLVDGQHLAVPKVGEPAPPAPASGSGADPGGVPSSDSPLDLNTATQAQLEALPGIGPSLAQAILAERERTGGFRSVQELRRVRGIGDARYAQIAPLVRV